MPAMTVLEQSRRESKILEQLLRNNALPAAVVQSDIAGNGKQQPGNVPAAPSSSTTSPAPSKPPEFLGSASLMTHFNKAFDELNVHHETPPVQSKVDTLRSSTSSYNTCTASSDSINMSSSDSKASQNSLVAAIPSELRHVDSGRESANSVTKATISPPILSYKHKPIPTGKTPRRSIAFTASTKKGSPTSAALWAAERKRAVADRAASDGDLPPLTAFAIGDGRSVRYAVRTHPAALDNAASNKNISSPAASVARRTTYLDAEDGDGSMLLDQLEQANTMFDKRRQGGYNLAPLTRDELQERVHAYQRRRRLWQKALWALLSILLIALIIAIIVTSVYFVESRYRQRDSKIDMEDFYDDSHPPPAELRREIQARLASRGVAAPPGTNITENISDAGAD